MRAIWKGAVAFGLVNVPVKLYAATGETGVTLHQVHEKDGGRIHYRKVCSVDGEEVPAAEIAKGYETDGRMVVLSDADLAELPLSTEREIAVEEFVPAEQVDPIMLAKTYYLEPEKTAAKPYALLREALRATDRMAVVKVALRQREQMAVLRVRGEVICLQTLLWPDEIREADFPVLDAEVDRATPGAGDGRVPRRVARRGVRPVRLQRLLPRCARGPHRGEGLGRRHPADSGRRSGRAGPGRRSHRPPRGAPAQHRPGPRGQGRADAPAAAAQGEASSGGTTPRRSRAKAPAAKAAAAKAPARKAPAAKAAAAEAPAAKAPARKAPAAKAAAAEAPAAKAPAAKAPAAAKAAATKAPAAKAPATKAPATKAPAAKAPAAEEKTPARTARRRAS